MLRKDEGRFEEVLAYFDESFALNPPPRTLKFPWQNKADTLSRMGRFDEAKTLPSTINYNTRAAWHGRTDY
ncbi:MAG: hypothetical protein HC853_11715 [Anaerolineae bacterium]|nr:hypothetical protein [Anaerolineae bacterium]